MKNHYHTNFEHIFVLSIGLPILWHGYRAIAGWMVKRGGSAGKIGGAIGGVFTFGGMS